MFMNISVNLGEIDDWENVWFRALLQKHNGRQNVRLWGEFCVIYSHAQNMIWQTGYLMISDDWQTGYLMIWYDKQDIWERTPGPESEGLAISPTQSEMRFRQYLIRWPALRPVACQEYKEQTFLFQQVLSGRGLVFLLNPIYKDIREFV